MGQFTATTCQNLYGFALVSQYSVTSTQQLSYAVQYASTGAAALVPLNSGASFHPAVTNMNTPYIVVMRPGTFGLLMTASAGSTASYSISTTRDPDARQSCAATYATTGVRFNSALTSMCVTRDINVVPIMAALQALTVSVTAPSRPVKLELINAATGAVLADTTANPGKRTATLSWRNGGVATRILLRISGSNVNEYVPVEISP